MAPARFGGKADCIVPYNDAYPATTRMEAFHRAYIDALAAAAGITCFRETPDVDKTDTWLKHLQTEPTRSLSIQAQLKSTSTLQEENEEVVYDLDAATYNKLADPESSNVGRFLIVMELPNDPDQWASCDHDRMLLRRRAFWTHLYGKPQTPNTATQRIRIPKTQLLRPGVFPAVLAQVDTAFQNSRGGGRN